MAEPPIERRDNPEQEKTIDVLDVLILFADKRRFLAIATFIGLVFGAAISLIIRPTFKASALILPPQQQQSTAAALVGSLGALAGLGSGGSSLSSLGLKNPAEMYVGILGSRTIADDLIRKFDLQREYKTRRLADTEVALKHHSHFEVGKDGLIEIDVKDPSPQRASDLANGYLDALYKMNSNLTTDEANQRKVFFDRQLNDEKKALENAEIDLRNTEQKTGVIQLSAQAATIIRGIADTRAEIDSSEVQLQAMNTFATAQNPDAVRLQQKIAALRVQLTNLENSQQKLSPGDIEMPAGQVPQATLEYVDKYRELQYHETLFELLAKQFEAARLDEAKSAPVIQVVDYAVPPDRKSWPPRTLLTIGAGMLAFCFAGGWLFFKNALAQMEQDPERAVKLHRLRSAFRK